MAWKLTPGRSFFGPPQFRAIPANLTPAQFKAVPNGSFRPRTAPLGCFGETVPSSAAIRTRRVRISSETLMRRAALRRHVEFQNRGSTGRGPPLSRTARPSLPGFTTQRAQQPPVRPSGSRSNSRSTAFARELPTPWRRPKARDPHGQNPVSLSESVARPPLQAVLLCGTKCPAP